MARGGGGSGGVGAVDIRGWGGDVVQNRESPDFRSAEVGRYANEIHFYVKLARTRLQNSAI